MSASIEINLEECTGCKTCVEACFAEAALPRLLFQQSRMADLIAKL